jgi:acyl dehydratase
MSYVPTDFNAYVGADTGPFRAWDAVNAPMIRHWCEALGDACPIYTDPGAACAQGYPGVVAPPTMLQAWTMYGYAGRRAPGSDDSDPMAVLPVLEAAGYPGVVAVNCEQTYPRYLEVGEEIYHRSTIESISAEKTTALGVGYFVTQLCTYFNQCDEVVGSMRFRVFKYRPAQREPAPQAAGASSAAVQRPDDSHPDSSTASEAATDALCAAPRINELVVGDALPELIIPITTKLVVGGAIASRDYQDVHHDKDAAQALGSPDIFMNILTTNGLVGRFVTDWAGPGARLKKVAIRLGAPNFPGDRMTLGGKVSALVKDRGKLELEVSGRNGLGEHVSGTVQLAL